MIEIIKIFGNRHNFALSFLIGPLIEVLELYLNSNKSCKWYLLKYSLLLFVGNDNSISKYILNIKFEIILFS